MFVELYCKRNDVPNAVLSILGKDAAEKKDDGQSRVCEMEKGCRKIGSVECVSLQAACFERAGLVSTCPPLLLSLETAREPGMPAPRSAPPSNYLTTLSRAPYKETCPAPRVTSCDTPIRPSYKPLRTELINITQMDSGSCMTFVGFCIEAGSSGARCSIIYRL